MLNTAISLDSEKACSASGALSFARLAASSGMRVGGLIDLREVARRGGLRPPTGLQTSNFQYPAQTVAPRAQELVKYDSIGAQETSD